MTHEELLGKIKALDYVDSETYKTDQALLAVVELHEPFGELCYACTCQEDEHIVTWPCQTIRAIQRRLI